MRRQPLCVAAAPVDRPEISGVGEHDVGFVDREPAKQRRRRVCIRRRATAEYQHDCEREFHCQFHVRSPSQVFDAIIVIGMRCPRTPRAPVLPVVNRSSLNDVDS
jgi:hypothetical protein